MAAGARFAGSRTPTTSDRRFGLSVVGLKRRLEPERGRASSPSPSPGIVRVKSGSGCFLHDDFARVGLLCKGASPTNPTHGELRSLSGERSLVEGSEGEGSATAARFLVPIG